MTPEQEAAVRTDERLKTLREVRNVASKMNHDPANDPYAWGFGGIRIVAMLTAKLALVRDGVWAAEMVKQPDTKVTLDEYNRHWIIRLSSAHDLEELASWVADARQSEHWNGKLAKHVCALLDHLRVED